MRLAAALVGNLEKVMEDELKAGAIAVSAGTGKATIDLKNRLRAQVIGAFGSQRLANTWRSNLYPKGQPSLGASGTVHSNAPHIIEAFSASTVIRSPSGFFLAIPSPDCPKINGGRRVSPSNWPSARFGDLHFVYRRGKASLLVVDGVSRGRSGRVGRKLAASKSGGYKAGAASVVMFFLVPFVRLKQVFDLDREYDRALSEMVGNIITAWEQ